MLVRDQMTSTPITVPPGKTVPEALSLMRERRIRRLPVVDRRGKLAGIVTDRDLLYASPSPATSLSVWELNYLLGKLTVEKVMTRDLITVADDAPIEEAARLMADHKIGGLPVVKSGALVGIITETDVFRAFLELLGARRHGVRITAATPGAKGTVARIAGAIVRVGGNIVGLGFSENQPGEAESWEVTLKVQDVARDVLVDAVKPVVDTILDVRDT
ncbi:MAG TPA: CBS domain-containing protein [Thermoanaerobaculaceae bacterium]|nr:CBS domain-containing protein [Thermoanaerobaculaceae bacterium]